MRLGFERDGIAVELGRSVDEAARLVGSGVQLVIAGAESAVVAHHLLAEIGRASATSGSPPLLYLGNGIGRAEALAAGADEVIAPPAFIRDVVTVGKLLASSRPGRRGFLQGELGDTFGVYYLLRALSATCRSGVLILARGFRRGEVRFFEGEVTSAGVGMLHGQAAVHQLLLWTDAKFEFRHEDVVRRHQIPMSRADLFRDAERFLLDTREVVGGLSPSSVFEQDPQRLAAIGKKMPTEIHGVIRLFDGHRTLADVIEDSAFRVFETMRVVHKAIETGLIRRIGAARVRGAGRFSLPIETWLWGTDAVVDRPATDVDTAPAGKRGAKLKRARTPIGEAGLATEVDWSAMVPAMVEVGGLSGVVPSSVAAGEIMVKAAIDDPRKAEREGLEAVSDAQQRARMFPTESDDATPAVVVAPVTAPIAAPTPTVVPPDPVAPSTVAPPDPVAPSTVAPPEPVAPSTVAPPEPEPAPAEPAPVPVAAATPPISEPIPVAVVVASSTAETAPIPASRALSAMNAAGEMSGEIRLRPPAAAVAAPEPVAGPSILIEDLAAARDALLTAAQVVAAPPAPAAPPDASERPAAAAVAQVRSDAVAAVTHFTEAEEAFFETGRSSNPGSAPIVPAGETFADLDEGYQPQSFWDRLLGRTPRKPR